LWAVPLPETPNLRRSESRDSAAALAGPSERAGWTNVVLICFDGNFRRVQYVQWGGSMGINEGRKDHFMIFYARSAEKMSP
jgi:hypothetical protein